MESKKNHWLLVLIFVFVLASFVLVIFYGNKISNLVLDDQLLNQNIVVNNSQANSDVLEMDNVQTPIIEGSSDPCEGKWLWHTVSQRRTCAECTGSNGSSCTRDDGSTGTCCDYECVASNRC